MRFYLHFGKLWTSSDCGITEELLDFEPINQNIKQKHPEYYEDTAEDIKENTCFG